VGNGKLANTLRNRSTTRYKPWMLVAAVILVVLAVILKPRLPDL
jgi:Na+/melibiose symporter-like transporter